MKRSVDTTVRLVLVALSVWVPAGAAPARAAEAGRPYTLPACVRVALANSAAAMNAARDLAIGRLQEDQARAEIYPQLSFNAEYRRLDEVEAFDLGGTSYEMGALDNYSGQAAVDQLVFSGGGVGAALRAAGLGRQLSGEAADAVDAQVVREVRLGFAAVLLARETLDVRASSLAQLEAHAAEAERKRKAGTVSAFDLLSARVRVANERPAVIAAHNAERVALLNLQRLLNLDGETFDIEGDLVLRPVRATLADLLVVASRLRPDLSRMETEVLLREQDTRATRSGTLPSVRAFFTYNGANSFTFAAFEDEWAWHWNAGVRLEWDFWDGGLTRARVDEKRLEWEKAGTRLDDLAAEVRVQVRAAYLETERAARSVEAGDAGVELAGQALEIARSRYEAGLGTHLEFLDSQLALSTARLGRLQALHDHVAAVARLEYACGLDMGALDEENLP